MPIEEPMTPPLRESPESDERLQEALAAAGLGTWRWDIRADLYERDAGFNRILGLAPVPSALPLRDFLDRIHPDDLGPVLEAVDRAVRGRAPYEAEHRIVRPDGSVRWLRDRGRIIPSAGAVMTGAVLTGAVMDVTELHQAEEARAQLGIIFETSEDGICTKSADGTVTAWNAAAERIFGFTAAEVVGSRFSVPGPPGPDRVAEAMAAVLRGERVRPFETERLHKDGRPIHVSVSISAIRDATGRGSGAALIARDITDRRRSEEALRVSEERFRLATEAISGLIYDWDPVSDRVERSQGLVSLLGYWPEEVHGELAWWRRQIHPDDLEHVRREIMSAVEGNDASSFSVEYRVRHRDGTWIHVWDKGLIVRENRGGRGRAVRVVGSTIDISDRKRSQEALEAAHRELQEAAGDQGPLPRHAQPRAAHAADAGARPSSPPWPTDDAPGAVRASELAMIRRNVELEARLIDDLLDLTRIARGKLELHRREIDARRVIEHALSTAGAGPRGQGAAPGGEPGGRGAPPLGRRPAAHPGVLEPALSNAVKFTPPGGRVASSRGCERRRPAAGSWPSRCATPGSASSPRCCRASSTPSSRATAASPAASAAWGWASP